LDTANGYYFRILCETLKDSSYGLVHFLCLPKERALFQRCFLQVKEKPAKIALKSEPICVMFNSRGLFMATLTKKIAAGPVVLKFFF
jgi:hypothetical protein